MDVIKSLIRELEEANARILVEGDRLRIEAGKGKIDERVKQLIRQHKEGLINYVNLVRKNPFHVIPAASSEAGYPLSSSQHRLWIACQFAHAKSAYNLPAAYLFEGRLDTAALDFAFASLIERHEILRTIFKDDGQGVIKQFIRTPSDAGFQIKYHDLLSEPDNLPAAKELVRVAFEQPFDLQTGPLIRAEVIRLQSSKWIFVYCLHHIISDEWSGRILIDELMRYYDARANGRTILQEPLKLQYRDYASWQQGRLQDGSLLIHKTYWMEQMSGELPVLDLPADHLRPAVKTNAGGHVCQTIDAGLSRVLRSLCKEQGATLFMGLLAMVNALLYRYTGQEDIIIGSPIAGRGHPDLESQIGFYVNMLALRSRFSGEGSFLELLEQVRIITLEAYEHQEYPLDELSEDCQIQRDLSRNVFFDVMLVLHNAKDHIQDQASRTGELTISSYGGDVKMDSQVDLSFSFEELEGSLNMIIVFNSDIYEPDTIARLSDHFVQLLQELTSQPLAPISQAKLLLPAESGQLSVFSHELAARVPLERSVTELFDEQAEQGPERIAVSFEGRNFSYRQLQQKANQLAHYLRNQHKVGKGDLAGIMLERSENLIIAILAILKTGAAYVPLDPDLPETRKRVIARDTGFKVLIINSENILDLTFFEGETFAIDVQLDGLETAGDDPSDKIIPPPGPADLAYIMYTSGSTGVPKGVMVDHRAIVRLVKAGDSGFTDLGPERRLLSTGAISFDATTFEYWGMLLNGGRLVLCGKDILMDTHKLEESLQTNEIDIIWCTAGWLHQLVDQRLEFPPTLKTLIAGGDALSANHIKILRDRYPDLTIINGYGPTENTTFSCTHRIDAVPRNIPVGRPVAGSSAFITDLSGQLQPLGVAGEIRVGGEGLARGYLNDPDLTADVFPVLSSGLRVYRTGDKGRWLPDGNIEFLGRIDQQVKIRGYRIEPGEIEYHLLQEPNIVDTVVVARVGRDGAKELIAYVVTRQQGVLPDLHSFLAALLPDYMIPAHFVVMDKLPLSPNGKVDRNKLPLPAIEGKAELFPYLAPRTETESELCRIWQDILGKERVGIRDDFFRIGGHSLKAARLASQIHKIFDVRLDFGDLFTDTTPEQQAVLIDKARPAAFRHIPAIVGKDFPLSSSQRRLWVLSQFEEGNIAYNIPIVYIFEGSTDPPALQFAFDKLIERHEILRTVFREDDKGEIRQIVRTPERSGFKLAFFDMQENDQPQQVVREKVQQDIDRPFELSQGPLLRANLYQLAPQIHVFSLVMHHIISDGWSMEIMFDELLHFYNAYCREGANRNGVSAEIPLLATLRIQYKDFAAWQQDQLKDGFLQEHKAFWLGQLSGELPVLNLQGDMPRPAIKTYHGGSVQRRLPERITRGLMEFSASQGGTLFMGILTAINALLNRYTGQEDIIIGSPIAGRNHADLDGQIGFYVNTLALRTTFNAQQSFLALFEQVKHITLDAYEHQDYPFDELVEELHLQRDMSRSPLFDVMVVLQNTQTGRSSGLNMEKVQVKGYDEGSYQGSKFDLVFGFWESGDELVLSVTYNSDIFHRSTAERLTGHLERLIGVAIADPSLPVNRLECLGEEEIRRLLYDYNNTMVDYPKDKTLVSLFLEQTARTPDNIALVYQNYFYTYGELNAISAAFAALLRDTYGIRRDELVGVKLGRSEWLIISILGILRSGGAYVPMDPEYPEERIRYMVADSGCKLVVDEDMISGFISARSGDTGRGKNGEDMYGVEGLHVQGHEKNGNKVDGPNEDCKADDLAYVIYTSGSTGKPKGVLIEHKTVVNLINAQKTAFGIDAHDNILQFSTISFDASVEQIFLALTSGATLTMIDKDVMMDPELLEAFVEDHGITHVHTVPGILKMLPVRHYPALRRVISGGDKCPKELAEQWSRHHVFFNKYGPTETTITAIELYYNGSDRSRAVVPLGRPLPNTYIYIEKDGQLCPVGVPGEIFIGGAGVARGYLNRPELSEEKFIADPRKQGMRIYRTGDVGKWLTDGQIEFIGRVDAQVKVRGFRMELGEIENALVAHPDVQTAVVAVMTLSDGEKELVGYFTGDDQLGTSVLRSFLAGHLPGYMIPGKFVRLERMPMTPTGKIDRKALPDPEGRLVVQGAMQGMKVAGKTASEPFEPPVTPIERTLAGIWSDILGISPDEIGLSAHFFNLGGHSLKATRLAARIRKLFEVKIALKDLFIHAVLQEQARLIGEASKATFSRIMPAANAANYPLSSAQRRLWVLSQFQEASIAYNMPGVYTFEGALDQEFIEEGFLALIARHEILRTVFRENEEGEVRQFILGVEESGFRLQFVDVSGDEARELLRSFVSQPFDLETGPLLKALLCRIAADRWIFAYNMHHIVSDGWSMEILINELLSYYNNRLAGRSNELAPLRIQYKDYAIWQQDHLKGGFNTDHKKYWLERFSGELPVAALPADMTRPAIKTFQGQTLSCQLSSDLLTGLRSFCQDRDATLFMGLLACVNILLYRYTGQEDMIIGTPIAGREHADLEDQIGFYVNTLPLRTQFAGGNSFENILEIVKEVTLGAYEHQAYPFDELVENLHLQKDLSRNALFDVMVVLQQAGIGPARQGHAIDGVSISPYNGDGLVVSKFDWLFSFSETSANDLFLQIEYNSDIYKASSIQRLLQHFDQLLRNLLASPQIAVDELNMLAEPEKERLIQLLNNAGTGFPADHTIVSLFEEQAARTPGNIALQFELEKVDYATLNQLANQWAHYCRDQYGIKPDDLVGLQLPASQWLLIAMLGILKAGAAYLPIDPEYPQDRREYMMEDSGCRLVIDESELLQFLSLRDSLSRDNPVPVNRPSDLAYVIYTSGTTGRPKGVLIEHQRVVRLLRTDDPLFDFNGQDVWTLFHSYCFDFSVWEIYGALLNGGRLIIVPPMVIRNPDAFLKLVADQGVTVLNQTPGAFYNFIQATQPFGSTPLLSLRYVIFGGEALQPDKLLDWHDRYPEVRLINMYGITETTVHVTYKEITRKEMISGVSNIGRPIPTLCCYLLDRKGNLVPQGVAGELYVGGQGVARGYLNKADLTCGRFIPDPFRGSGLLYRSGDLVVLMENGDMKYLGRIDDQVKIRGYRIELAEIERRLREYPDLTAAVVLALDSQQKEKELVAYVTGTSDLSLNGLRSFLGERLPAYMIPHHFIRMDHFPLTENGKIDKKALPKPAGQQTMSGSEYVAPRNALEQEMVQIWQEVLGRDKIGIRDGFFEAGGDSIKILRMASAIKRRLGIHRTIADLYRHNTIESLLAHTTAPDVIYALEARVKADLENLRTVILDNGLYSDTENIEDIYPMSEIEKGMLYESAVNEGEAIYHDQIIHERVFYQFDPARFRTALELLVSKHEILRTAFNMSDHEQEVQIVYKQIDLPLTFENMEDLTATEQEKRLQQYLAVERENPFVINLAPLWRMRVFGTGGDNWLFVFQCHHAIIDGWSDALFATELNNVYLKLGEDPGYVPGKLRSGYKDLIIQQLIDKQDERLKAFWRNELAGYVRPDLFAIEPSLSQYYYTLDPETAGRLQEMARNLKTTTSAVLLSSYLLLLRSLSGDTDVLTGLVTNTRPDCEDSDRILGCFLNSIPFRMGLEGEETFSGLVVRVREKLLQLKEVERFSLYDIAKISQAGRGTRSQLFDVLFNYVDFHEFGSALEDTPAKTAPGGVPEKNNGLAKIGYVRTNTYLNFTVNATGGTIVIKIHGTRPLHSGVSISSLGPAYQKMLDQLLACPDSTMPECDLGGVPKVPVNGAAELVMAIGSGGSIGAVTHSATQDIPPRTDAEKQLVHIWQKLLGVSKLGIRSDFFQLGGHSIAAMKLQLLMNKEMGIKIRIKDIYDHPTIEGLLAGSGSDAAGPEIILLSKPFAEHKEDLYLIPPILGNSVVFKELAGIFKDDYNCFGIQYSGLGTGEDLYPSIEKAAREMCRGISSHRSDKITILGYSLGAAIAFEMARILERKFTDLRLILVDRPVRLSPFRSSEAVEELEWLVKKYQELMEEGVPDETALRKFLLNNLKISNSYIPRGMVRSPICVLESSDNQRPSRMKEWNSYTNGDFSHAFLQGDHWAALHEKNFSVFENRIARRSLG